ncbi:MAG TPA: hypothetical protein VGE52_21230 [Pirellulales bacterium]
MGATKDSPPPATSADGFAPVSRSTAGGNARQEINVCQEIKDAAA